MEKGVVFESVTKFRFLANRDQNHLLSNSKFQGYLKMILQIFVAKGVNLVRIAKERHMSSPSTKQVCETANKNVY